MLIGAQLVARGTRSRAGKLAAFCSAAALGPEPLQSLIRSPALHPWLRLLSESLFLTLLPLLLWLLFFAYWSFAGRREALARDGHRAQKRPQYQNQSRNGARAACGRRLVAAYPRRPRNPLHLYRVCCPPPDSRVFALGGGNGTRLPASVTSI